MIIADLIKELTTLGMQCGEQSEVTLLDSDCNHLTVTDVSVDEGGPYMQFTVK